MARATSVISVLVKLRDTRSLARSAGKLAAAFALLAGEEAPVGVRAGAARAAGAVAAETAAAPGAAAVAGAVRAGVRVLAGAEPVCAQAGVNAAKLSKAVVRTVVHFMVKP